MKNTAFTSLVVFKFAAILCASALTAPSLFAINAGGGAPLVISRGPNSQVVQWVGSATNSSGAVVSVTNTYTQLMTGLNYRGTDGAWHPTVPEFQVDSQGNFVADQGQHKVVLPPKLGSAPIQLTTSDGVTLNSKFVGLAYYDAQSGQSVWLGLAQDSAGQLVSSNQVLYPDVVLTNGIRVDLLYTYTPAGFEQDVVLETNLPSPGVFNLSEMTTRLIGVTAFLDPPNPTIQSHLISTESDPSLRQQMTSPDFTDETLGFGAMQMIRGRAYLLPTQGGATAVPEAGVPVGKTWTAATNSVSYLIEAVQYPAIKPLLQQLSVAQNDRPAHPKGPDRQIAASQPLHNRKNLLGPRQAAKEQKPSTSLARQTGTSSRGSSNPSSKRPQGVALDYITVNSSTDYLFKGDTTYYCSGSVILSGDNNVAEGGTVIKFSDLHSAHIQLASSTLHCKGTEYRPVVLTAKDDNSIGQTISGSTGDPTASFYGGGLLLPVESNLHDMRFSYLYRAIEMQNHSNLGLTDCTFPHTFLDIYGLDTCYVNVTNALMTYADSIFSGFVTNATNWFVTMDHCTNMADLDLSINQNASMSVNESLGIGLSYGNIYHVSGYYFVSDQSVPTTAVFMTILGGNHYLAPLSAYRNYVSDASSIPNDVLRHIRERTTYPPILITTNFTADTTLSPIVPRDTDKLDLGYHYPPLDYAWTSLMVTNATLTLTGGVAVAYYGGRGTELATSSSTLISQGLPNRLNEMVRYSAVQEGPDGDLLPYGNLICPAVGSSIYSWPTVRLVFTDVSLPADGFSRQYLYNNGGFAFRSLSLFGCHIRGANLDVYDDRDNTYGAMTIAATNNLIERSYFEFYQEGLPGYYSFGAYFYNNLFQGGTFDPQYNTNDVTWLARDNLFDGMSVLNGGSDDIVNDHNGYYQSTHLYGSTGGDKSPTAVDYLSGDLGDTYYPTTGGHLSILINAGSRSAANGGLSAYTTTTDGAADGSTVDIGYHYYNISGSDCVTVSATQPTATAGGADGEFTVTRQGTTGNLTVYYQLSGSAVNGTDYSTLPGSVMIPDGSSSAAISVAASAVSNPQPDKTVILALAQGAAYKICSPSSALVTITDSRGFAFKTVAILNSPIGIDYDPLEDSLIVSMNYDYNGGPYNFVRIDSYGTVYGDWGGPAAANFPDEIKIAIARNSNGFNQGDTLFGTGGYYGRIGYMSGLGQSFQPDWLELPDAKTHNYALRGGLCVDQTGVFSGDLIVVCGNGDAGFEGDVYRVKSDKSYSLIAQLGVDLEGVTTTPMSVSKYGPLAGKILTGEENSGDPGIYSIDTNGTPIKWPVPTDIESPENVILVAAGEALFCADWPNGRIIELPANYLTAYQGDIVLTGEKYGLFLLHWNGYDFDVRQIIGNQAGYQPEYEQATFAPLDLPAVNTYNAYHSP